MRIGRRKPFKPGKTINIPKELKAAVQARIKQGAAKTFARGEMTGHWAKSEAAKGMVTNEEAKVRANGPKSNGWSLEKGIAHP